MAKDINKKRKQDLGIFYTPQEVVDFIFDILNIWKNKEDKETHRWQTRKPKAHYPSVIDPACGEGVFLKTAVTSGFTGYHPTENTPYVFGVDMDGDVVKRWEEISILNDLFKGKKDKMLDHFHQQDGLLQLPDKVFNYKTGGLKEFDAVVGNPPYGGIGFSSLKEKSTKESIEILEHLRKYEVLVYKKKKYIEKNQTGLFGSFLLDGGTNFPSAQEVESLPIEILFIDRFIQLAKPGGWVTVIIPDGILTNSNTHYVRDFISKKAKIEAIVSLPRDTFQNAGTNAKTSILFLRKLKEGEEIENYYPVLLASVSAIVKKQFDLIVKSYEKFYNLGETNMDNSDLIQITTDQNNKEVVMVRVDKMLRQLMEEKPASRWNPNYWHPKYDNIYRDIKFTMLPFKKYIDDVQGGGGGSHFSAFLGDKWDVRGHYATYLHISALMDTGINWVDAKYVDEKTYRRLITKQLRERDILLSNKGTIGKSVVVSKNYPKTIVGDTRVIRVKEINPFYVCIYFKSKYGKYLSERFKSGVASEGTTVDQLGVFEIPDIPNKTQSQIELIYKNMSGYHDKAMDAKKNDNNKKYKENLTIADKILKELINKTEEVIEGKREDMN